MERGVWRQTAALGRVQRSEGLLGIHRGDCDAEFWENRDRRYGAGDEEDVGVTKTLKKMNESNVTMF